jgi:hypothetical protein
LGWTTGAGAFEAAEKRVAGTGAAESEGSEENMETGVVMFLKK